MEKPIFNRVVRQPLSGEIAERIRQSIISGRLPPGIHLPEAELATQMGVSRGPIREALRLLESEGIIYSIHNRGSYVSSLSKKDILEVYSLRSILEEEAARLAAKNSSPDELNSLFQTLEAMRESAKNNELHAVIELDINFHRQIWKIAGHGRLTLVLESILTQIKLYLSVQTSLYSDLAIGISDHEPILQAINNKDEILAANLMRQHIDSAAQTVTEFAARPSNKSNL